MDARGNGENKAALDGGAKVRRRPGWRDGTHSNQCLGLGRAIRYGGDADGGGEPSDVGFSGPPRQQAALAQRYTQRLGDPLAINNADHFARQVNRIDPRVLGTAQEAGGQRQQADPELKQLMSEQTVELKRVNANLERRQVPAMVRSPHRSATNGSSHATDGSPEHLQAGRMIPLEHPERLTDAIENMPDCDVQSALDGVAEASCHIGMSIGQAITGVDVLIRRVSETSPALFLPDREALIAPKRRTN